MPGAPSFIALDWGTSSLRAWRFGESPNPQEKREFPWGIMKLPSQAATREDAFHDTFLRVCGDWLAQTPCPVLACGMLGSAQGWQSAALFTLPGHSRGSGEAVDACYPPAADNAAHHSWRD